MKRIVLAEDHAIIRDGLKLLLMTRGNWCVSAETGDGLRVVGMVLETRADLVLLDLDLPGCSGMGLIEQIRARSPQTKILVLTASQNHATARLAMAAGADGYMLKHEEGDELFHAISLVLSGIRYVSKALIQSTEPLEIGASPSITTREKEILGLIANGYSSQDIARKLNVSVLTIRKHRQNLMTKLSLHNVAEVTAYAIRDGLSVKRRGEE